MRPFDEENWLSAKRATAACGRAGSPWPIDPAPCRARQCEARPRAAWISNLRRYLLPLLLMPKSLGFLQKPFADGGYQGPQFCKAQKKALPCLTTEIVKRSDAAKGFEVLYQPALTATHLDSRIGRFLIRIGEPKEVRHGSRDWTAEGFFG